MKVLIVESTGLDYLFLKELLKVNDIDLLQASTGTEAVAIAKSTLDNDLMIGLIVIHNHLKDISTYEVCRTIKEFHGTSNIPIIIYSSGFDKDSNKKAFEAGADDYIHKPFNEFDIVPRFKSYLKNYQLIWDLKESNVQLNSSFEEMRQISDMLSEQNDLQALTEEKLLKSQKKYKLAINSAEAGTFFYDLETRFFNCDKRTLEIFGYNKEKIIQSFKVWMNLIHPDDIKRVDDAIQCFISSNDDYLKQQYRIIKPNGEEGYLHVSIAAERNEGKISGIYGLCLDFSEQYRAEQALKQSELKFKKLTESLYEIIWSIDLEGNISYLNNAFTKIFGYQLGNGYPKIKDIFTEDTIDLIHRAIEIQLAKYKIEGRNDETLLLELTGIHKNGEHLFLETSSDFIYDKTQNPIAIQGIMRDITQRKKDEKEIEMYQKNLKALVRQRTNELNKNKL